MPDAAALKSPYTRQNPFPGRLTVNRRLNPGSQKDTRHLEVDLTGWGLSFVVGDSMAVYPSNDPVLVDEILHALGATGDELVPPPKGDPLPLRAALSTQYLITQPTPKLLRAIAERASGAPLLKELLHADRKQDLETYLYGLEVIDFLAEHPSVKFAPEEFVGLLAKLQPRLYSIASSPKAFPDSVHFTLDVVRYESHGRKRGGVCSTFMAERANEGPMPVFPTSSKFRMPDDPDAPIIMVGPGTGIAPFRAFLQERQAIGARGKAWLFFGSQREQCDYFYKDEFEQMRRDGYLTRIDCAFSRDQEHKIYVQHRMEENGAELWKWMEEEGAHFFVCGDAKRMAKDVDAALKKIVQTEGGTSPDQANEYIEQLKKDKRYKRDVY
ncbi:MAG TPA: sulfite reductase subunit alpha [Chthoniobacterales bacterium]|nr:sulfite reductase subunit alpha [Chthoniobacterales bacterium]